MSSDPKWKSELLRCGLPLESEAARLLVSKGFGVASDFKYARVEGGRLESLSIDLHAKAPVPPGEPGRAAGALDLIVECRHAPPGVCWLFLADPNQPAGSAAVSGHTIRVVDEFSLARIDAGSTAAFDAELPVCRKGLEIDQSAGRVDDAEPDGALVQLQYALPRLMAESVLRHFRDPSGRHLPFLFCPVLLSTAPLLVANRDLDAGQVEQSSGLRDLAAEVPYLVVVCDHGPDFHSHCQRQFRVLEPLERNDDLLMVETKRAAVCQDQHELPLATIESLLAADRHRLQTLFSRFIVCTAGRLAELVDKVQQTAAAAVASRQGLA